MVNIRDWFSLFKRADRENVTVDKKYYIVCPESGICINIKSPVNFDWKYPTIKEVPEGYRLLSEKDLGDYIPGKKLFNEELNGCVVHIKSVGLFCNWCDKESSTFYICKTCKKYMCVECFELCKQIHWWDRNNINPMHSDRIKNMLTRTDGELKCWEKGSLERVIGTYNSRSGDRFGSYLDWIPVLINRDGELVLYNINSDSDRYHSCALTVDTDRGRRTIHCVPGTLDSVIKKLQYASVYVKYHRRYFYEDTNYETIHDYCIYHL